MIIIDRAKCNWPECFDGEFENEPCWTACDKEPKAMDISGYGAEVYHDEENAKDSCSSVCDSCGKCISICPEKAISREVDGDQRK